MSPGAHLAIGGPVHVTAAEHCRFQVVPGLSLRELVEIEQRKRGG